jgi:hypothetical protein
MALWRSSRTTMSRTTMVLLAVAATLIGACGVGPERAETSSDTVQEEPPDAAPEGTATGAEGAPTTTGAAAVPRQEVGGAQGEVLASAEAELAESPGSATLVPVRLDIVSMERLPGELSRPGWRRVARRPTTPGSGPRPRARARSTSSFRASPPWPYPSERPDQ